jgi:multicomponent Na+:H+ antiporter subunit G
LSAEITAIILLFIGCFFLTVVTFGLFRLPDALSRLHLSSKCDTMGTISVLLALAIYAGWSYDILQLAAIGFLVVITSVTSSHAIGRSALKMGLGNFEQEPPLSTPGSGEENASDT